MDVHIQETRNNDLSTQVILRHLPGLIEVPANVPYDSILDQNIGDGIFSGEGVDHPSIREEYLHLLRNLSFEFQSSITIFYAPVPSKYRTAILTATPFRTCWRINECSPSATSAESSTSRLIGPGCKIKSGFPASVRRSR